MLYKENVNTIDWAGGVCNPEIKPEILKSQYVGMAPLSCLLVYGEYARNPQIRVDEIFRLWGCDVDYSMQIQKITNKKIWYTCLSKAIHFCSGSSKLMSSRKDIQTCKEALDLFAQKWKRII
jgi:hypothetical protein